MPTCRMSYSIKGQKEREQVEWTPEPGHFDMPSFARWVMNRHFPGKPYSDSKGMEAVLRAHGITDIRSPDVTHQWVQPSQKV